jgi:hypothetical protein
MSELVERPPRAIARSDQALRPQREQAIQPGERALQRSGQALGTPSHQAFRILHVGYVAAPTIAGADKFFHLLVDWDKYLAPAIARLLPVRPHSFMLAVGGIEVAAGLLVAVKPKLGGAVVAAWLGGITANLLIGGRYLDIALRDFGLMLGALALSRLATQAQQDRRAATAS